jgi:hypothetical protein
MVAAVREGIHGGNRQRRNSWWQPSEKEFMVATVREGIHGGNRQRKHPRGMLLVAHAGWLQISDTLKSKIATLECKPDSHKTIAVR